MSPRSPFILCTPEAARGTSIPHRRREERLLMGGVAVLGTGAADGWIRTRLLASVEAVLLDPRTLGRGVFRAATARRLVAETRAGRTDHSHLFGVLLHIEL